MRLALAVWCLLIGAVTTAASATPAEAAPLRPYEAPIYPTAPDLPPLPAEYLKHDQAGIRFAYHPSARERVRALIEESDAVRAALSALLGEAVLPSLDVRVALGRSDFERVAPAGAPSGAGVVALSQLPVLIVALRAEPMASGEVRAAFRRGMAHLALDQVGGHEGLPRWLRIGFALHFAEAGSLERARVLWWASLERRLLPLDDLDLLLEDRSDHDSMAAAEAADFVAYLLDDERAQGFAGMVRAARNEPLDTAMQIAFDRDAQALEAGWRGDVAKHKAFAPIIIGGTALWVLVVVGVKLRQRMRARKLKEAPLPEPRMDRAPGKARKDKRKRGRPGAGKMGPPLGGIEPEVPKVAHNGRWHTLH